ncbi:MAG: protein kinase [Polyangiaceae bacterium]|nr:protein kinase [Polyangiaceae bacterium]
MEIEPGTVVAQRYRVLRQLGRGGMGEVFAAENIRTGRTVAVKVLRSDSKQKSSAVERFRREARAAGAISSDYVTQVLDVEDDAEHGIVIVFELLEGESLIDRLKRTGPMTFDELFPYVEQVWMGLTDAHKSGVIHRDLKPSNVFLERRPDGGIRVKLLDFGISKIPKEVGGETLTEMGQSLGTFSFMPPEQIGKAKTVDHRADIYAASTLIYQAMSGQLPYAAKNILQMVDLKTKSEPRPLSSVLDGHVDPRLEAFLAKGLARDPDKRFQSAAEALDAWRVMKRAAAARLATPTIDPSSAPTLTANANQRHSSPSHVAVQQPQISNMPPPQPSGRTPATVMLTDPRSHNVSPLPSNAPGYYSNPTQHLAQVQQPPQQTAAKLGGTVAMPTTGYPQARQNASHGSGAHDLSGVQRHAANAHAANAPAYAGAAAPATQKGPSINVPVVNDTTSEGGGDHVATIAMPVRNVAQAIQAHGQLGGGGLPRVHEDQAERGQMGTQLMSHAALRQAGANIPQTHRSGSHQRPALANTAPGTPYNQQQGSPIPPGMPQQHSQPPQQGASPLAASPLAATRADPPAPQPGEGGDLTTVYRREKHGAVVAERRPSKVPMIIGVVVVALLGFAIAAVLLKYFQTGTLF